MYMNLLESDIYNLSTDFQNLINVYYIITINY